MALQTALRIPLRVQSINSHYHPLSFYEVRGLIEFFFRLSFSWGGPDYLSSNSTSKILSLFEPPPLLSVNWFTKKDQKSAPKKAWGPNLHIPQSQWCRLLLLAPANRWIWNRKNTWMNGTPSAHVGWWRTCARPSSLPESIEAHIFGRRKEW